MEGQSLAEHLHSSNLAEHLSSLLPPPTAAWPPSSSNGAAWPPTSPPASHVMDMEAVLQHQPPPPQQAQQHHDVEAGNQHQQQQTPPPQQQQQQQQQVESGWSAILASNPELRSVVSAAERYIPFVLIVCIKSVFEHGTGIIVCLGLILTFLHANSVVKQQVSRQGRRNLGALLAISINLIACILFIYYVFQDDKLYLSALFIPPHNVSTFYDLLWIVGVNDFILKYVAVLAKVFVTVLPAKILAYQKRGKHYLFIEVTSQLHRQLAPLQPWLIYLLQSNGEGAGSIPNKVLGVFLTAAYMVVKGKIFMRALKLWRTAFYKLLQSTRYGEVPNQDQIKASGGSCPICQDSYQEPTMLKCSHIFCEECVATWFDRDTTCPMCRAKVTEDPSWRDGATSQFIQLF